MKTWHYIAAMALLLSTAVALQVERDEGWQPHEPATPVMWLQAGPAMERAVLGYDALVSDIYWMRAVVYFGRQRLSQAPNKNYDLLYPLLKLVTTLDPRFIVAYRFGAIFLSEQPPGGPARPDLAIELLEAGMQHAPDRWEYPRDIGFVYYWGYRNARRAAEWFTRASEVPGAPLWLKTTAAMMLSAGGDRESARRIWEHMYEGADNDWLRNEARIRLAQFDALDQIDQLNLIVWRYEARMGRFPGSWQHLVDMRVLRGIPVDPAGVPYVLDRINEDVRLSQTSPLWPLPAGLEASAP
jgi:hypothetical protein